MANGSHAQTGLISYDAARWSEWTPRTAFVHRRGALDALVQFVPKNAVGANETSVPANPKHVLLMFTNGAPRLHARIGSQTFRRSLHDWESILLPAGYDSWWQSTPEVAEGVFHLHLDNVLVERVAGDLGKPLALRPVIGGCDPMLTDVAKMVYLQLITHPSPTNLLWDTYATMLGLCLIKLNENAATLPKQKGGLAPRQLKRVMDYLNTHLSADVTLTELAGLASLSPYHFCRAFKQSTGMPPHAWQTRQRIERAKEMMRLHPSMGLGEIGLSVGYVAQTSFSTAFKRLTGVTPARWRREQL